MNYEVDMCIDMFIQTSLDEGTSQRVHWGSQLSSTTDMNRIHWTKTQGERISIISIVARDTRGYGFCLDLQILKSEQGDGSFSKSHTLH